jgi:bifunctional DNA-binding transcriptional regulator/antitoxin component of YhaV-PrlF toxin-antitoxin module
VTDVGNETPGISIPIGLREEFDIEIGDEVGIDRDDGQLIVDLE